MKKVNIVETLKKMSRFMMCVLTVVLTFQTALIFAEAETVGNYNVAKAVAYAKEHYDDSSTQVGNKQDCIQFVRECMEAGGVVKDENRKNLTTGKPYGYDVDEYVTYLLTNGYAEYKKLETEEQDWATPQWYVRASDNAKIFSVGDGIIYVCTRCDAVFHAALYTGVNEDGFAEYYAQNKSVGGDPLCKIDCSKCKAYRDQVELYSLHITSDKNGYDSRYNNAVVTGLKAVTNSNDEVEITWDALNGATGYNVFKKNGKTSAYSYIGTTESNTFIYGTQPELTKCFYFAVRPYIKVNGKTYVGQMCDMYTYKYLGLVGEKLEAPKLTVTCDPDTGKPQLSWEPVPGASGYEVERAKSKTGTYFNISNVAYTSVINKSAEAGTTYYYKVRAKAQAADGSTAYSEYSTIKSVVCDLERPTIKVTNVESSGKPKVSWSAVKNANKYNVYRATKSTGTYKKVKTTTSKSYTDTSATAGKKYYYKVEAVYSSKTSANSALSEYAYKTCKLAAPKLSATNTSAGKPKVTWDAVKGADKYEVYRATSKSGTYKKVTTTSKKYYTDSKASKGKTYYYKVKSVDKDSSAAKSAYSTVVSKKCK